MANRANDLTGKEWLQNSFSIWRDLKKTQEEKNLGHPASYPISLCEKLIKTFARNNCNVLDPFNGVGTTMVAAENLGCNGTGIDLSEEYCNIARKRITSDKIKIYQGDSFKLVNSLEKNSFDLVVTSPPYWDILNQKRTVDQKNNINYSDKNNDLGNIDDYWKFIESLKNLFANIYPLLKHKSYCLINVMDLRKGSNFYSFHSDLAYALKDVGYIFDDLIIWDRQADYNNMKTLGYPYKFRINKVHEYILIMYKE
ncbi:MAG: site-specific DNA-methyltransferase [Clostridia bacterium]|nr:site-specific DNA-methyltransferase [Clostridia bacterium]